MKNSELSDFEVKGKYLIVRLNQELDHHIALEVKERADRLIAQGNIKNVIFDFKGVEFMDSSGIGVIMGRYKKLVFIGGKVAVANVGKGVDRIFMLSGLYKIIVKYETVNEAMASL